MVTAVMEVLKGLWGVLVSHFSTANQTNYMYMYNHVLAM